jgi:hypothetical protein
VLLRIRRTTRDEDISQSGYNIGCQESPALQISLPTDLLCRPEGTTRHEMVRATGWQPHSSRAVLTSPRKKSHTLATSKRDELTGYRITDLT